MGKKSQPAIYDVSKGTVEYNLNGRVPTSSTAPKFFKSKSESSKLTWKEELSVLQQIGPLRLR